MITVRAKGGLGNQLFQYATGYSLAKRLGQEVSIDISFFPQQTLRGYKLDKLNLNKMRIDAQQPAKIRILKNKYLNKILRQLNRSVIWLRRSPKLRRKTSIWTATIKAKSILGNTKPI